MIKKIAVFASGSGSNFQGLIDGVTSGVITGATIKLLVSSSRTAYCLKRAQNNDIASQIVRAKDFADTDAFSDYLSALMARYQIDYIVLAGYLEILPAVFVSQFDKRIINIHPSLIPAFCGSGFYGRHVHDAVYRAGVKLSGATVHFVDGGVDTGEIIAQQAVRITAEDTVDTIAKKVLVIEHQLLPRVLNALVNDQIIFKGEHAFINHE